MTLRPLLVNFKWYRKRRGGTWYFIYIPAGFNTIDGATTLWTQTPNEFKNYEILNKETWE